MITIVKVKKRPLPGSLSIPVSSNEVSTTLPGNGVSVDFYILWQSRHEIRCPVVWLPGTAQTDMSPQALLAAAATNPQRLRVPVPWLMIHQARDIPQRCQSIRVFLRCLAPWYSGVLERESHLWEKTAPWVLGLLLVRCGQKWGPIKARSWFASSGMFWSQGWAWFTSSRSSYGHPFNSSNPLPSHCSQWYPWAVSRQRTPGAQDVCLVSRGFQPFTWLCQ